MRYRPSVLCIRGDLMPEQLRPFGKLLRWVRVL